MKSPTLVAASSSNGLPSMYESKRSNVALLRKSFFIKKVSIGFIFFWNDHTTATCNQCCSHASIFHFSCQVMDNIKRFDVGLLSSLMLGSLVRFGI